ncbi:MAG: dTDP-4-dehydrorhamnose 3,5-epimerase [Pyrinomonadaceae bacterium]
MIAAATKLSGAYIIKPELFEDERGLFARSWSKAELTNIGVASSFVEGNWSFNKHSGTLRGMHYQHEPHGQAKLIRCTQGSIYDVGVDMRRTSRTFGQWVGIELTADNRLMLYLSAEFAHGFLTLEQDTEVHYQVTEIYTPHASAGFRWDDPAFGIEWPNVDRMVINKRDREYPDFQL